MCSEAFLADTIIFKHPSEGSHLEYSINRNEKNTPLSGPLKTIHCIPAYTHLEQTWEYPPHPRETGKTERYAIHLSTFKQKNYFLSFPVVPPMIYLFFLLHFTQLSQRIPPPFLLFSLISDHLCRGIFTPCCPSEQNITIPRCFLPISTITSSVYNASATSIQMLQSTYHYVFSALNL